jgi:hypothetical protein
MGGVVRGGQAYRRLRHHQQMTRPIPDLRPHCVYIDNIFDFALAAPPTQRQKHCPRLLGQLLHRFLKQHSPPRVAHAPQHLSTNHQNQTLQNHRIARINWPCCKQPFTLPFYLFCLPLPVLRSFPPESRLPHLTRQVGCTFRTCHNGDPPAVTERSVRIHAVRAVSATLL